MSADKQFPSKWGLSARVFASLAILWHLFAVLMGPFSTPPTILSTNLRPLAQRYMEVVGLEDTGYKFFAPSPGPSHLIEFALQFDDGSTRQGTLPDREAHWPRLYYHRIFMLSETLESLSDPNAEVESEATTWEQFPISRGQRVFAESIADHLLYVTGARKVTLTYVLHELPTPGAVSEGMRLDDERLYRRAPLVSRERAEP